MLILVRQSSFMEVLVGCKMQKNWALLLGSWAKWAGIRGSSAFRGSHLWCLQFGWRAESKSIKDPTACEMLCFFIFLSTYHGKSQIYTKVERLVYWTTTAKIYFPCNAINLLWEDAKWQMWEVLTSVVELKKYGKNILSSVPSFTPPVNTTIM